MLRAIKLFWKHVEDWVPALTPYYFPKLFERVPGARVEIQKKFSLSKNLAL